MLIAQITDLHLTVPGKLAYGRVDTAAMLSACVARLVALDPQPDLLLITGDLVDRGTPEEYAHLRSLLAPLRMPVRVIAGNHDEREALRAAFIDDGYLPPSGFLHYVLEDDALRIVGLDTTLPGQAGGELCADRLAWLATKLGERPEVPTLVMMHHPPFDTGIAHMDAIGLVGASAYGDLIERHGQVCATVCGHLHRMIVAQVGHRPALTAPSPAHQVALELDDDQPGAFTMEPPCFLLHRWRDGRLVSHQAYIGPFPGPYPFRPA